MIHSSVFSFDESSIWDPKVTRQHLNIPEDQLNILNNIPEWSKGRDNGSTFRIEKDTICENSQSSEHYISDTSSQKNQEPDKRNTELFDKHFETRKSILETYKLHAEKFSKSISLFEIDKISKYSSSTNHLVHALSVPNIHQFSRNLYSKNHSTEFGGKDSSLIKNMDSPTPTASGISNLKGEIATGILRLKRKANKASTVTESFNMEVDSQLSVATLTHADKVKSIQTKMEIAEKDTLSASHSLQSSSNLSNSSSDQPNPCANAFKLSNNCKPGINEKSTKLAESEVNSCEKNETGTCFKETVLGKNCNSDVNAKAIKLLESENLNSCEINKSDSCLVKETAPLSNDCNPEASEKATKLAESEGLNSCEKNKLDSCIIKETVLVDINSAPENSEKNEPDSCIVKETVLVDVNSTPENSEKNVPDSCIVKETVLMDVSSTLDNSEKNVPDSCIVKETVLMDFNSTPENSEKNVPDPCIVEETVLMDVNSTLENSKKNVPDSCIVKETVLMDVNSTPENSEKNAPDSCIVKETVLMDVNSTLENSEQNEVDLCIVKETVLAVVNSVPESKRVEINANVEKLAKENDETSDKCSKSFDTLRELCTSKLNLISSNKPENKLISSNPCDSKIDVENAQMKICQEVSDSKSVKAQKLSIKRKVESKNRPSKRSRSTREKQEHLEERSVKKAGEICYSAEHIKTMLSIMKQFL